MELGINLYFYQVVQLNALRPTADTFCSLLRDALKAELQRGKMKAMKTFVKTCYTESLILSNNDRSNEREDGSFVIEDGVEGDGVGGAIGQPAFHGGLGFKYKFPGDPKKWVI